MILKQCSPIEKLWNPGIPGACHGIAATAVDGYVAGGKWDFRTSYKIKTYRSRGKWTDKSLTLSRYWRILRLLLSCVPYIHHSQASAHETINKNWPLSHNGRWSSVSALDFLTPSLSSAHSAHSAPSAPLTPSALPAIPTVHSTNATRKAPRVQLT